MFSNNNKSGHNIDISSLSKRLCAQAQHLSERLQEKIANDLPGAIEIARQSVSNNCIVALLAMVQGVRRDVNDEFRPVTPHDNDADGLALNDMADAALLTLMDLYNVGESFLKFHGWYAIDQSSTISGGIVYEHNGSGEVSEEPMIRDEMNWEMRLILSIPVLIQPGVVDGKVVWAATVIYYHHIITEESDTEHFDLECHRTDGNNIFTTSVIDVLKSDEDGQSAHLRGVYNGCWTGLYAEAMGEMDTNSTVGQHLELWTETTLAGLSVTNQQASNVQILVIGLAGGQLVSFLKTYISNVELTIIEPSQTMFDIAVKYYHLHPTILDCVSIIDPIHFVKRQRSEGCNYDTILVNICSSDETFPSLMLNSDLFNGLVAILSDHPSATLLVNGGKRSETVFSLVDNACKHIYGHRAGHAILLREYLLRDHTMDNNEGAVIAARRREWSLSVENWQREHVGEDSQLSGAMDVANAQRTQVVRLEKFLSLEDIEKIHSVAKVEFSAINKAVDVHTDSWNVLYLHNNNLFQRKLPLLRQRILDAVRKVDNDNWHLFDKANVDHFNIRCVEYHQMDQFGELADPKHYDLNSLLTMDIMLSEEGAFEGGDLQTEEVGGTLKKHEFKQGDALIFVSHKYHCVDRVTSGRRNVVVLEFWYGPERQCPHRCERFGNEICNKDPAQHVYTQQYHSTERSHDSNEENPQSINLPFRLGSASISKQEGSPDAIELLWEPASSNEDDIPEKPRTTLDKESKDAALSDAFACFGESSDSDDD